MLGGLAHVAAVVLLRGAAVEANPLVVRVAFVCELLSGGIVLPRLRFLARLAGVVGPLTLQVAKATPGLAVFEMCVGTQPVAASAGGVAGCEMRQVPLDLMSGAARAARAPLAWSEARGEHVLRGSGGSSKSFRGMEK